MPGTDTPRLFQGAFRQLNKFFVVISVNLYLTRGHYISVGTLFGIINPAFCKQRDKLLGKTEETAQIIRELFQKKMGVS